MNPPPPIPAAPVELAVIGCGHRAQHQYAPLFASLAPWVRVAAVCDPLAERSRALGERLGATAFTSVRDLLAARPMEAALVIAPVEVHHALSVQLSRHGVHNLIETTWCSTLHQARDMIAEARSAGVVTRVAENFFRFPIDRIAVELRKAGWIGRIGRIVSYADHTGFHNGSRWIAFAGAHPASVQCVEHAMAITPLIDAKGIRHDDERFSARFVGFPDGLLVADLAANVKGRLGRHPRPGYTEWQGERGALVHRAAGEAGGWGAVSEIRIAPGDPPLGHAGMATETVPVRHEADGLDWRRSWAERGGDRIAWVNHLRTATPSEHPCPYYSAAIMGHVADFACAVRGLGGGEFDERDALASMMLEVGARESALRDGARVALPLDDDPEADACQRERLRQRWGVDPYDAEAMLEVACGR